MDVPQLLVAWFLLVVFALYLWFWRRGSTEGMTGSLEAQIAKYVDDEFTKYYRPTEAGYLYLLTVVSKDAEFIKLSETISPTKSCMPPPEPSGSFVPATITFTANRGWFDQGGPAYTITPPQFDIPPLDSDEVSPQNKCGPDPKLLKSLAEQVNLINTQYRTIPFLKNSRKYGLTTNIKALPRKGIEAYIFTLHIMIGIGTHLINKIKSMGKTIDVAGIKANAKKANEDAKKANEDDFVEPFEDNCCEPATEADLFELKLRAAMLAAGDAEFQRLLKLWAAIEKELRGLFKKLEKGFTRENLKEFGFNEADFILDSGSGSGSDSGSF
jgi:hypothetical protein